MFGLKEENGREEKMNQGGGKNVDPCDKFLNKFNSFLFYHSIQTAGRI